ncbi:MAG: hypothetical protein DMG76_18465 [Acidobacteria bacterium]|nr:MAG: hypothetical protein DMG76_18465 [Acidobacteriota bacterium]
MDCVYLTSRHKTLVLVVLFALGDVSLEQASGQVQGSDNRQNIVHGTVVNAVTHEPVGRALVYSSDNRFATLTDGEGHFQFTLPEANLDMGTDSVFQIQSREVSSLGNVSGPSWLTARKPGFLDDPNESPQAEPYPGEDLTISLMPEGLIKGRVLVSASDLAAGIDVEIFARQVQDGTLRWMPRGSIQSNSNGEFRFAELLPGAYKLVTHELMDNDPADTVPGRQLYGFPPVYYPGVADFSAASTIQLTAGQTFQADISLLRQPYYPVRIPVTNAELNGGMPIVVSVQGQRGPGYSLGYDAGKKRIEGLLPNGNYLVGAETFGPNSSTGVLHIAVAGVPVEGPSMVLSRTSSIILNVKEEFSETNGTGSASWSDGRRTFSLHGPRLYLQVSVEAADDFQPQHGVTIRPPIGPNDDSLVIENIPPGRYWLRLSSSRGYVAAASVGAVDLLYQPLVVGPGSTEPIEITMRDDSAEIEGTVAGVTAQPAMTEGMVSRLSPPRAWVYCVPLPDSPGQFAQLAVGDGGKFQSQTMVPGVYRLLAFKSPQANLPYRDAEAMRAYDAKGQVVHLSAAQKTSVYVQIISHNE